MEKSKQRVHLLATVMIFVLSGCAHFDNLINKIPEMEFTKFEYHRGGNFSTADIVAIGGKIEGDELRIEYLKITSDWGPFFNLNMSIEGYKRKLIDKEGGS